MLLLPFAGLLGAATEPAPAGPLALAIGGDMIGPYAPGATTGDPAIAEVSALFRGADLGLANQEGSIFDVAGFAGDAASESGGGYPLAPAGIAAELKAFGIGLVSKANNHATDFGTAGLRASLTALGAAGIAQAGAGRDRVSACAPTYVARAGGTIALVSAATTYPPMAAALPAARTRAGPFDRPGICTIRTRLVEQVTRRHLAALRAAAGSAALPVTGEPGALRIGDLVFRAAPRPGHALEADPADVASVLAAVRAAHAAGAVVVLAVHTHETAGTADPIPPAAFEPLLLHRANEAPGADEPAPAAFAPLLFHAAIDAGADLVLRTGPHAANGVELYRSKPILWGLGSLVFAFGGRRTYVAPGGQTMTLPDAWFSGLVATVRFDAVHQPALTVYPVALAGGSGPQDGMPRRLHGAAADAVLERFRQLSGRFGTGVVIAGGVATLAGSQP